jgi:glycyl-tRNA synthetase beta subunit
MIAARIQTVQQELVDSEFSLDKQKEYYDELKADYVLIDFSAEKELMAQQEEMSAIYQARKRKLDLVSKRNEKDI